MANCGEHELTTARTLIADLDKGAENNEFELSEWEADFVDSLRDQLEEKRWLTTDQYRKLEEVHRRKL